MSIYNTHNEVTLLGPIIKDIHIIEPKGMMIATLTIATNELKKNKDGKYEETSDYLQCKLFGKMANNIVTMCGKGSVVFIKGKIRNNNYTNKDGKKVYGNDIWVSEFKIITGKKANVRPEGVSLVDDKSFDDGDDLPF